MDALPVLDASQLQSLLDLGADASLALELIAIFEQDVPPRLQALAEAWSAGDAPRLVAEAHYLKGSLGNLGLLRFADQVRVLELGGRDGRMAAFGPLVEGLPAAYAESLAALKAAFPG